MSLLPWTFYTNKQDFLAKCDKSDATLHNGWILILDHIDQQSLWSSYQLATTPDALEIPSIVSLDDHFVGLMNVYGMIQFNIFHRDGLLWAANDIDSLFYLLEVLEGR